MEFLANGDGFSFIENYRIRIWRLICFDNAIEFGFHEVYFNGYRFIFQEPVSDFQKNMYISINEKINRQEK